MNTVHAQNTTKPLPLQGSEQNFLTVDQALALLNGVVGRSTFYKAVREGWLPSKRFGKRIIISRRRLIEWLEGTDAAANNR
jgi:excisionase family DNA binding protein